jgi:Zn-dependent protease with chaperone function
MVFLLSLLFSLLLLALALSYITPFLRKRPSVTVALSKLRILLVFILMISVPIVLAFVVLSKAGEYTGLSALWTESKAAGIFYFLSIVCFLLGGTLVPFTSVFYFYSGYKKFMKRQDYDEVFANSKDKTLRQLWEIFSECMNAAGVKAKVRLLVAKEKLEYADISDCGVVGKGKNAAMLLSAAFVNLFREEKLNKEDVKSIFLHELSHVLHSDHFMPLWALWFSQSKVFTYTIVSFVAGVFFVFLSAYSGGKVIIKGNLLNITRVFAVVAIAFVIFKRVIWNVINIIMREREFLADIRSARLYATDKMVNALKKWGIFLPVRGSLPAFSFAGILRKVDQRPSLLDRIEALGQKKEPEPEKNKIPSALQMASYCLYFVIILVVLFIPFIALPGTDITRLIIIIGWASSFLIVTALVIENVFALRFLDRQVFEQSLSRSFTSKLWIKIHLNNFLIALIICSLIALSGFVFDEDVTYVHWHRTFFFRAVLFYFLYCTVLSLLLVAVYWREKKKKATGREEAPVEVVWDKRRKPKS